MRLYISADIEGVAGVVSREQTNVNGFEYASARRWMTDEVLAVMAGARCAGATRFVVADAHGNGQNLLPDAFAADTDLIRSWPRPLNMMEGIDLGTYAGAALIGYHAGVHSPAGTLAHSFSTAGIAYFGMNGSPASEARLCAAVAGHFDVPVLLVSGDDAFVEEASSFIAGVEAVITKRSLGWHSAMSPPPQAVCQELQAAAERAMASAADRSPLRLAGPVTLDIELMSRRAAEALCFLDDVERTGGRSIRRTVKDAVEAARFVSFLLFFRLSDK